MSRLQSKSYVMPANFASVRSFCNATGLTRRFVLWALANGCAEAQDQSNRLKPAVVMAKASELLDKIAAGSISIDGRVILNKDQEQAQKFYEERLKLEDERRLRDGQLMEKEKVEEFVWNQLAPLRAELVTTSKKIKRQIKAVGGIDEAKLKKCDEIVAAAVDEILKNLRNEIPKKKKV